MKSISKIITAVLLTATCSSHLFAQDINLSTSTGSGDGWEYSDHVFTIKHNANITVTGNDENDYRRILIEAGAEATVTLAGATINNPGDKYAQGAIMLNIDAKLTLNLVGINSVTGPYNWPVIAVMANENVILTI
jgi:hypothetical protein